MHRGKFPLQFHCGLAWRSKRARKRRNDPQDEYFDDGGGSSMEDDSDGNSMEDDRQTPIRRVRQRTGGTTSSISSPLSLRHPTNYEKVSGTSTSTSLLLLLALLWMMKATVILMTPLWLVHSRICLTDSIFCGQKGGCESPFGKKDACSTVSILNAIKSFNDHVHFPLRWAKNGQRSKELCEPCCLIDFFFICFFFFFFFFFLPLLCWYFC